MTQVVVQCYGALMRLYPANFRAEFADEMQQVFALAAEDAPNFYALAGLCISEGIDLPWSLIREHLRERRQNDTLWSQEGVVMRRNYFSPRLFRWCIITLFSLFVLYVCSAVLAYIVFDLAHHDLSKASEWWYDVGDQPGYIGNIFPLTLVGAFLWVIAPVLIVLAGGFLVIMLWRQWDGLSRRLRRLGITALLVGSAMFLTMGSPIGYMAALWLYD